MAKRDTISLSGTRSLPYMPVAVDRLLGSRRLKLLSRDAQSCWLWLWAEQWQYNGLGLLDDSDSLCDLARCPPDLWRRVWPQLQPLFKKGHELEPPAPEAAFDRLFLPQQQTAYRDALHRAEVSDTRKNHGSSGGSQAAANRQAKRIAKATANGGAQAYPPEPKPKPEQKPEREKPESRDQTRSVRGMKPRLDRIRRFDLTLDPALMSLFIDAGGRGWHQSGNRDLLLWFSAAEHALRVSETPPKLFRWIVDPKKGSHYDTISEADEAKALERIKSNPALSPSRAGADA